MNIDNVQLIFKSIQFLFKFLNFKSWFTSKSAAFATITIPLDIY